MSPRSSFRRAARGVWRLVLVCAVAVLVLGLAGLLPSGTSAWSLAARAAAGVAAGLIVVTVVRRSMRSLANPPPAPAPMVDARSVDVVYECPLCGTRLRLEVAATGKAPKHCGEEMEPRVAPAS